MEDLKLNNLAKKELTEREMGALCGGYKCGCGCQGPSSTFANGDANAANGWFSPGENKYFYGGELEEAVCKPE